jgi:hypothetical protein
MARDFEDIHDIDDLDDAELKQLVLTHLAGSKAIDADDITVTAFEGKVHLAGRVGTAQELQVAEHIVTDVLGIETVVNELVVDPIRRAESPEAIDDHLADEAEHEGLLLGDRPLPISPEAEHLADSRDDSRQFGTVDVGSAIADGTPWIPPESPTPEGLGEEAGGSDFLDGAR